MFVNFLKNRLIFNICYCPECLLKNFSHISPYAIVLNICEKTFYISSKRISQKVKGVLMWNLQHFIFIWRRRYWQIFKYALVYLLFQLSFILFKKSLTLIIRCKIQRQKYDFLFLISWAINFFFWQCLIVNVFGYLFATRTEKATRGVL